MQQGLKAVNPSRVSLADYCILFWGASQPRMWKKGLDSETLNTWDSIFVSRMCQVGKTILDSKQMYVKDGKERYPILLLNQFSLGHHFPIFLLRKAWLLPPEQRLPLPKLEVLRSRCFLAKLWNISQKFNVDTKHGHNQKEPSCPNHHFGEIHVCFRGCKRFLLSHFFCEAFPMSSPYFEGIVKILTPLLHLF